MCIRDRVKGLKNYRFEDLGKQSGEKLLKKGITIGIVKRAVVESLAPNHGISSKKKKDVEKFLKLMYGEGWQN